MRSSQWLRWTAVTVFTFSSVLNYLDRFILATMVDIWRKQPEFPFNYSDYGTILAVFGITYAISAPLMGLFIDRVGLNRGISISVLLWSLVSLGHGFVHSFRDLLFCRAALGVVEAGGISAVGKVSGMYLRPKERAVGAAMSQLGLSVGAAAAPAFTIYFATHHNWRWAFFSAGILGLLWIPTWLGTSKAIPPVENPAEAKATAVAGMVKDRRIWGMAMANALSMTFYSLWTNWAPVYLVKMHHLTPTEASHYSWIVPFCGYFGAFLGGSISWQLISRKGFQAVEARKQVCFVAAILLLFSAFIPLAPTPLLATAGMSLSYFLISAWSTNLYTIPVDIFGAQGAAFGVSSLVCAYGLMQAVVSKPLGQIIEQRGFQPVLIGFSFLPLIAYGLLAAMIPKVPVEPGVVMADA